MERNTLFAYALNKYKTEPEYLWKSDPDFGVLRHSDNNKWYGLVMNVSKDRLGLDGKEKTDILNVKCEPAMIGFMILKEGILPAYHMNKNNWISILLDSVPDDFIYYLLDKSYELTAPKKRKK